jgi:hypothetical protein
VTVSCVGCLRLLVVTERRVMARRVVALSGGVCATGSLLHICLALLGGAWWTDSVRHSLSGGRSCYRKLLRSVVGCWCTLGDWCCCVPARLLQHCKGCYRTDSNVMSQLYDWKWGTHSCALRTTGCVRPYVPVRTYVRTRVPAAALPCHRLWPSY